MIGQLHGVTIYTAPMATVPASLRHGPRVSVLPPQEVRDLMVERGVGPATSNWLRERDEAGL